MNKKKILTILSSTAILFSLASTPFAVNADNQSVAELEQEQKELENKSNNLSDGINDAEEEMNSLDVERQELMNEITNLQENITDLIKKINEQQKELDLLEEEIEELNGEIATLQEQIDERNEVLAAQARGLQTGGSPQNLIDLILTAESLTELIGKIEVVNLVVKNNNTIMEEQVRDQNLVKEHKESVDLAKQKAIEVKENMEANRANLESQKDSLDSKVEIVSEKFSLTASERDTLLSNQDEIKNESNRVKKQIKAEKDKIAAEKARKKAAEEKRIAEAQAKAQVQAQAKAQAAAEAEKNVGTSSSGQSAVKPNASGWGRPASGYVTSEFGYRIHPIYGTRRLHGGIDIGGSGAISASRSGRVTVAQYSPSWGNYVKIDHGNGVTTLYAHMQSGLRVSAGQSVSQGQQLGTMGTTGSSTGVHLHFEVHQNGDKVNPRNYVNF